MHICFLILHHRRWLACELVYFECYVCVWFLIVAVFTSSQKRLCTEEALIGSPIPLLFAYE